MIYRSNLEEIKNAVCITEVIEYYGIQLKNNKACCPFHEEKTASFIVNPKKKIFKCFGCGVGGDIFSFVQLYLGCDFKTALFEIQNIFNISAVQKPSEFMRRRTEKTKSQLFDEWVNNSVKILSEYYRRMHMCIKNFNFHGNIDNADKKYLRAVNDIDKIEYWLDILICGGLKEKTEFYNNYREEVSIIERRIGNTGCGSGLYKQNAAGTTA